MIKHCMDCGAKLDRLHDSKNILRYECKTCMAIWVRTVKIVDSWDKQESSHIEIKANGFRITTPGLPSIPADEHLTMQQAIQEAAKTHSIIEKHHQLSMEIELKKLKERENDLFGDDDK